MDNIIKLLSENNSREKNKLKKLLKCNNIDIELLLMLINSSIEIQTNEFNIGSVIQDFYELNEEKSDIKNNVKHSLNYLQNIKNLINLGWLRSDCNFTNKNFFDILNSKITIDNDVFYLIEKGSLNLINISNITAYDFYYDYLEDCFLLIDFIYQKKIIFPKIDIESPKYKNVEANISLLKNKIKKRLEISTINIPLEDYKLKYNLSDDMFYVILFILKEDLSKNETTYYLNEESIIFKILSENNNMININDVLNNIKYKNESIFLYKEIFTNIDNFLDFSPKLKKFYYFKKDFFNYILPNNQKINDLEKLEIQVSNINKENNFFELIEPKKNIEDIYINNEINNLINVLKKQSNKEVNQKLIDWGIKEEDEEISERIIFFGDSGTGKTITTNVIANSLNKQILTFDCSRVFSMYIGESEKNIKKIFDCYKNITKEINNHPILVLNEADQLFSKRTENGNSGSEKTYNSVQNLLLEEIEKFKGILICTTNMLNSFDKAFSRRFNHKIKFNLPNFEEKLKIWKKLLPKNVEYEFKNIKTDINEENNKFLNSLAKHNLSGGQIDIIIRNVAKKVAINNEETNFIFKYEYFEIEINKEKEVSFEKEKEVGFLK